MASPLVSIITPCFNSSAYLVDCINSVMLQSLSDWEQIIVDDGSTDASAETAAKAASVDERIRLLKQGPNQGVAVARNAAIEAARGRYIAFLDADDLWLPEKLEIHISKMQANNWVFSYSDYAVIDADGNTIRNHVGVPPRINYTGLLKNTAIGCLTVVIDSERVKDLAMPKELRSGQDYALWYRILREGHVAHGIDRVLAKYRLVQGSVSRNKFKAARRMWRLYREYERLNPVISSWYFLHYAVNAVRKHV